MRTLALMFLVLTAAFQLRADQNSNPNNQNFQINADQLKKWIDQNASMVIFDARSKEYYDGNMIPGAKWLPFDANEEEIRKAAPSKDTLIVVYCAGEKCPASARLKERLNKMGYKSVYEYHGGLSDWFQKGFPINRQ